MTKYSPIFDGKANYKIEYETAHMMLIRDLGPWDEYMTVTNAAERVVAELASRLQNKRLWYYDSAGIMAEIKVINGRFAGFGTENACSRKYPCPEGLSDI